MLRHVLFAILAFASTLTIPDQTLARSGGRAAFTVAPHRVVLPSRRPHFAAPAHIQRAAPVAKPQIGLRPVARHAAVGLERFRRYHRGFYGAYYPLTFAGDAAYYGAPYDPSDRILATPPVADDADPTSLPPAPVVTAQRGCRAQHVLVPNASRAGESEITIIRC